MKLFRWLCLFCLLNTLTGCFYWIRTYQTYLQMGDFDQHFTITKQELFNVNFKTPTLYSDDFISLSKLQPSQIAKVNSEVRWRYWFRKVDEQGIIVQPQVKFYFDLFFNKEDKLIRWSFSPLFLEIAPAEFLELSLRSLGHGEINKEKRQLKINTDSIEKISVDLPKKSQVLSQLGEPLLIKDLGVKSIYIYHFQLETKAIEEGYENRALSIVKLTFNEANDELVKMAGRFIGLKISINYQKYTKPASDLDSKPEQEKG